MNARSHICSCAASMYVDSVDAVMHATDACCASTLTLRMSLAACTAAVPWQSAAMKSTAQDDPHFKLFRLVLRPKPADHAADAPAAAAAAAAPAAAGAAAPASSGAKPLTVPSFDSNWDGMALEAQLPWPLGVLITPSHMKRYNALFQLLLRLKRVQLSLEQTWQELGRCGGWLVEGEAAGAAWQS